jgi:O-methyltransferase
MGIQETMRVSAVKALDLAGLGAVARKAKASGWWMWKPLVPKNEFHKCVANAVDALRVHEKNSELGDYLEFGVSRGTSMSCVYHVVTEKQLSNVRLFGFDSFEGLPQEAAAEGWRPGAFKSTLSATQHYLFREGVDLNRVTLTKGWFKDTCTPETRVRLKLDKASLIMVDCDIETASLDVLRFSAPHIKGRAVVLLDDWASDARGGQRRAFEQFMNENRNLKAEPMPSYTKAARVFMLIRMAVAAFLVRLFGDHATETAEALLPMIA